MFSVTNCVKGLLSHWTTTDLTPTWGLLRMSIEQGKKRLLSPGNTISPTNPDDKRRRNNSLEIEEDLDLTEPKNMEPNRPTEPAEVAEPSMSDLNKKMDIIMTRLNLTALSEDLINLVSKDDLKEFDDRLIAQNQEIGQLRDEMKVLKGNIDVLQSNLDSHVAANLAGSSRLVGRDPGRDPGYTTSNMAARASNFARLSPPQRRNLVIEGLRGESEEEIMAEFVNLTSVIGVTVYKKEIEQVVRMGRKDEANKKPGPVLLTLTRIVLRDNILKKKGGLLRAQGYEEVFINADEPWEVRKAKSFLRRAAYHAKKQGENVLFKHDQVTINGVKYTTNDYENLPAKFLDPNRCGRDEGEQPMEAAGAIAPPVAKEGLIRKGERMRITRRGLCFSGPSSYISNMAYIPIKFNNTSFESNEQGIQWTKAMDHQDPDLAREIKNTENSYEVKSAGGLVTATAEWKKCAPDLIEKMFEAKLDQHPELLERLIDTYPLDLIEASTDSTWGGGAPYNSEIYDNEDPFPGSNEFGKIATKVRDQRIEKMKKT